MVLLKVVVVLLLMFKTLRFQTPQSNLTRLEQQALLENPILPDKLFDPQLDEEIIHVFLEKDDKIPTPYPELSRDSAPSELVKLCSSGSFPDYFPIFICPLLYLYRNGNPMIDGYNLYENHFEAVKQLNNRSNYPCNAENGTSDVIGIVANRIFSGCLSSECDTPLNNTDLLFEAFHMSFVIEHLFPEVPKCDPRVKKPCTLRTTFVQQMMTLQERKCCCKSGNCAIIGYTQFDSLTPLLLDIVELY